MFNPLQVQCTFFLKGCFTNSHMKKICSHIIERYKEYKCCIMFCGFEGALSNLKEITLMMSQ